MHTDKMPSKRIDRILGLLYTVQRSIGLCLNQELKSEIEGMNRFKNSVEVLAFLANVRPLRVSHFLFRNSDGICGWAIIQKHYQAYFHDFTRIILESITPKVSHFPITSNAIII
jgi:hypothetical protein